MTCHEKWKPNIEVTVPGCRAAAGGSVLAHLLEYVMKDEMLLRPQAVVDRSALVTLQKQAKRSGKYKLSLREINAEITAARTERVKRSA